MKTLTKLHAMFLSAADRLPSPFLLAVRLHWGWAFFQTGSGKLFRNFSGTAEFFRGLHLPLPELQVVLAGGTELVGGLLLLAGLGARIVAAPLTFTMIVAYLTADFDALRGIISNPDGFIKADPFLFLLASLLVLAFGPGKFSLDTLIARFCCRGATPPAGAPAEVLAP